MYEIYGVAYGWNLSNESAREIVPEYLGHLGGEQHYSGGGEATTYIGIDVYSLDCDSIFNGLTIDQFNNNIQRELKAELKNNRFAQNTNKWRKAILDEFKVCLDEKNISQEEYDSLCKLITEKNPKLFWTWSTS